MAIDMTTVKQIMHNNKEVAKIEDGLGNILWQKAPSQQWHTLWSGSDTVTIPTSTSSNVTHNILSNTLTGTVKIRVTFTMTVQSGTYSSGYPNYTVNGSSYGTTAPTSPLEMDVNFDNISSLGKTLVGVNLRKPVDYTSYYSYGAASLRLYNGYFQTYAYLSDRLGVGGKATFKLTKLEAYY